jgi:hypothetical protein
MTRTFFSLFLVLAEEMPARISNDRRDCFRQLRMGRPGKRWRAFPQPRDILSPPNGNPFGDAVERSIHAARGRA